MATRAEADSGAAAGAAASAAASAGASAGAGACLYPRLLGDQWNALPEAVRRAHFDGRTKRLDGSLDVELGGGRWARFLRWALRMPRSTGPADTTLEIAASGEGELWSRRIGAWRLVTREEESDDGLREILGPLEFTFQLSRDGEALRYRQTRLRLRVLGLALPVPRRLRLTVDALEKPSPGGGGTRIHVRLSVATGLLLAYHGDLEASSPGACGPEACSPEAWDLGVRDPEVRR